MLYIMIKLKRKSIFNSYNIFNSSNKFFFICQSFFTCIKMSKNSSAEYYQGCKEILQENYRKRYQSLSKKKKNIKRVL